MIGYTKNTALGVVDAFAKITNSPSLINEHPILLVKNVSGMFWAPESGVNLLGDLIPGMGYMIYMNEPFAEFTFSDK